MPERAVLDTDVWVSALLSPSGASAALILALEARQFQAVWSEPLWRELREVLADPELRVRYRISDAEVRLLQAILRRYGRQATIRGRSGLCDDPGDDKVVETALLGKVAYLVSHNTRHFTSGRATAHLAGAGVSVLKPGAFLAILRAQPSPVRRRPGKLAGKLARSRTRRK